MISYRGDIFVKGKKFIINEQEYRFVRRIDEDLLFTNDSNDKVTFKESYVRDELKSLLESYNKAKCTKEIVEDANEEKFNHESNEVYASQCLNTINKELVKLVKLAEENNNTVITSQAKAIQDILKDIHLD